MKIKTNFVFNLSIMLPNKITRRNGVMRKNQLFNMVIKIFIIGFLTSISFYSYSKNIPKLPLEYFTKIGQTKNIILSPDGKHYLIILEKDRKSFFAVMNTATNKKTSVIGMHAAGKTVADIHWISNERIIYGAREKYAWDKDLHPTGELFAVNIDGSKHVKIFRFGDRNKQQESSNMKVQRGLRGTFSILDTLPNDPKHILLTFYQYKLYADAWRPSVTASPVVYKINTRNGKRRKVTVLPIKGPNVRALTDENNEVRFAMGVDESGKLKVFYRESNDDDWENFQLNGFENSNPYPRSFTNDNQGIYFSADVDNKTDALFLLDFKSKKVEKIYQNKDVDIYSYIYDYKRKNIIAVNTENPLPSYHYLNDEDAKAKIHKKLRKAFAGHDIYITSSSEKGDKLIVRVSSDKNAGDFYLLDTKTFEATYLSSNVSWVNPAYSATIEPIQVKSRDGLLLNGYLTLPSEKPESGLPLIVLPHGGPHSRDYWLYDWETQLFANRGYAVLQINFRGSSGYGANFQARGYGKWGAEIQDDITDATNFVLKRNDIDAERVCIYGSSFGGYAALMGGVREPDLYKCVIGSMGVYDLPLMKVKGNIAEYLINGQAYLDYSVGKEQNDLRSRSPSHNAEKLKANILLIHGAQDAQVPIEQAESLMDALDKVGKTYDWVKILNEGHGFNELKNRNEVYSKILAFLDKNIGQASN